MPMNTAACSFPYTREDFISRNASQRVMRSLFYTGDDIKKSPLLFQCTQKCHFSALKWRCIELTNSNFVSQCSTTYVIVFDPHRRPSFKWTAILPVKTALPGVRRVKDGIRVQHKMCVGRYTQHDVKNFPMHVEAAYKNQKWVCSPHDW